MPAARNCKVPAARNCKVLAATRNCRVKAAVCVPDGFQLLHKAESLQAKMLDQGHSGDTGAGRWNCGI